MVFVYTSVFSEYNIIIHYNSVKKYMVWIFKNIGIGNLLMVIRRCSSLLRCWRCSMSDVYIGRILVTATTVVCCILMQILCIFNFFIKSVSFVPQTLYRGSGPGPPVFFLCPFNNPVRSTPLHHKSLKVITEWERCRKHKKQEAFKKCWAHSLLRDVLHCHSPGVATAATIARRLRIDVHDDDNDNAWQRGPLWPHGMGPTIVKVPRCLSTGRKEVLPSQLKNLEKCQKHPQPVLGIV